MSKLKHLPPPASLPHDPLWFTIDPDKYLDGLYETDGGSGPPVAIDATGTTRRFITESLDSDIQRCQWHRIVLKGFIPAGCSVTLRVYTSELKISYAAIQNLDESRWVVHPTARSVDNEWDCLILGGRGKYLWLRVDIVDSIEAAVDLKNIDIEYPRISLTRYLPATFSGSPDAADFTDRFLGIFDTTLRSIESHIDTQAKLFDPMSSPAGQGKADFLTWLGGWVGIWMDQRWSESRRRNFLRKSSRLFDKRGTPEGLWELVLIFLGLDTDKSHAPPILLEHFKLRRWLFLGLGRLGEDAMLWGQKIVNRSQLNAAVSVEGSRLVGSQDPSRDPFHVYAHRLSMFVPAYVRESPKEKRSLEQLLKMEVPAHTQLSIEYVEPRMRIGVQSVIGFDTVVGRYPLKGISPDSQLGRDTVLTKRSQDTGSIRLGSESRIGYTTFVE